MVMKHKIKVLIVDDSALMRKALREIIMTDEALDVVGTARDGKDAIEKAKELKPDVITMDINMPEMDGLTSMQYILNDNPEIPVIIISSLTQEGAFTTFEALALGAFDFVAKPSGTVSSNIYVIGREIIEKIKLAYKYANRKSLGKKIRTRNSFSAKRASETWEKSREDRNHELSKVVVIGVSTGGPGTLMEVLPMLQPDLKAALIVVQHMPPSFTSSFAKRLGKASPFPFKEAEAGDVLADGRGFLAPGGYQLLVNKDGRMLRLSASPVTQFMPSVNVTMESVLKAYGGNKVVGVLMTGMGDDGADAMVKIREAGGVTIAEDESTAVVFGMPRAAIERGGAEIVVPSYRVAGEIIKAVNRT
jgi:two-component system chemotaxis response regulator CheB